MNDDFVFTSPSNISQKLLERIYKKIRKVLHETTLNCVGDTSLSYLCTTKKKKKEFEYHVLPRGRLIYHGERLCNESDRTKRQERKVMYYSNMEVANRYGGCEVLMMTTTKQFNLLTLTNKHNIKRLLKQF